MNRLLFTSEDRRQVFQPNEIHEARAHAQAGGIAIHLHKIVFPHSPQCFRQAVKRGEYIAHVFGQDAEELRALARSLGIKVVFIDKEGTPSQHLDCCGAPLKRLLESVT